MDRKPPRLRPTTVRRAILRITYKSGAGVEGGTYDYFDVPPNVADELVGAESHGQFVNWEIKPHYRCERVD
jgi:hypothetical protein